MFTYILSFFRTAEPELSVEEATKILEQDLTESEGCALEPKVQHLSDIKDNFLKEEYNFSKKVGTITGKKDEKYIIDNLYEFPEEIQEFEIGSSVSYQILVSEGSLVIYNVNAINSEWDTVTEKDTIVTTRVMICKVEKRDKRLLFLTPGGIKVNLDKVFVQFVPYVGDWLQLEVKYEVDETTIDLSGQVIDVNQISPLRPHVESGKISSWDRLECTGTINRKIFFDRDSLSCGYLPVVGDQVVAEIIESEQGKCGWRALKILPELMKQKLQTALNLNNKEKVEETHPGLIISECQLDFSKLNDTKMFTIRLTNQSQDTLKLADVEIVKNASQLSFCNNTLKTADILAGTIFELSLSCTSKTMGVSNELLMFYFDDFSIGKYVNINVNPNQTGGYYQRNSTINYNNAYKDNKAVIRGQRHNNVRFRSVKMPEYPVPKHLLELAIKYNGDRNTLNFIEELKVVKRSLFTTLNAQNYEDKFHTLIYMDEIANIIRVRQYDQDRACFIPNQEFLMLEIDNLAERRPSIVLGDRIMASDPLNIATEEYEGNVFKVGAKHVYLKFSSLFHDIYKGEDYSIRVIPGRATYRRQHHAVSTVSRNLGRDWLFPSKVVEKAAQLSFTYEPYLKTIEKKQLSLGQLREKAKQAKVVEKETNVENGGLKLEWYNTKLNCKQKDAVINVLKGVLRPLPYLIFGPPGTGKTVTLIECVLQVTRMISDCRILITAPSNSAADLIALRLIGFNVLQPGDLVRLVSVNYAVGENIPGQLIPYCATGNTAKEGTISDNVLLKNGLTHDCSRAAMGRHKITVSTCSTAGVLHTMGFPRGHFTHIFVDEAGQAVEPEVMIPVSFLDKLNGQVVLAGDPMQLGPVVISDIAKDCGLNESYLERLINRYPYIRDIQGFPDTEGFDPRLVTKLLQNYRSLSPILHLFSSLFYHGELIPTISETNSPEAKLLGTLEDILPKTKNGQIPTIVYHGVEGENYQTPDSPSWYNPHEAAQVFYYINEFIRVGLKAEQIGIITPYIKQVREIRQILREADFPVPKVGTVEDFQGQEFDVIVLSTVRSSRDYIVCDIEHNLGFVSCPRRVNVAISRAKCLLVIVGNPALLSYDTYWRNVISYCVENGAYTGCDFSC